MKVKYSDQVMRANVNDPGYATAADSAAFIDITSNFPSLEASDAILVKKVVLTLGLDSENLEVAT